MTPSSKHSIYYTRRFLLAKGELKTQRRFVIDSCVFPYHFLQRYFDAADCARSSIKTSEFASMPTSMKVLILRDHA